MSEYHFSQIRYSDRTALRQMEQLLAQEGIERDGNLDYTVGLYDEDYNLAATGSAFGLSLIHILNHLIAPPQGRFSLTSLER